MRTLLFETLPSDYPGRDVRATVKHVFLANDICCKSSDSVVESFRSCTLEPQRYNQHLLLARKIQGTPSIFSPARLYDEKRFQILLKRKSVSSTATSQEEVVSEFQNRLDNWFECSSWSTTGKHMHSLRLKELEEEINRFDSISRMTATNEVAIRDCWNQIIVAAKALKVLYDDLTVPNGIVLP